MSYILTMSLSGSCLYLMYRLVRHWLRDRLTESWYYGLLKVTALYFLIPLPWLKEAYSRLAEYVRNFVDLEAEGFYRHDDWVVFIGENGWKFNDTARLQVNVLGVWIAGIVVVGCAFLIYYLARRKKLLSLCVNTEKAADKKWIENALKDVAVRVPVQFKECGTERTPFTIGFLKPIVFYSEQGSVEEKEMMLKHELIHIKRKDMVWQFLSFVLVVMHWYNPLAWLFKRELESVCESSCDEQVLKGQTKKERVIYAKLLLKYMTDQKGEIFGMNLSKGAKEVEKRMKRILNRTKKLPTVVRMMLAVVLVVLNSVTVFAYEDVKVYHADMMIEDIPSNADIAFIPKGEASVWKSPDYVTDYVRVHDNQFVDKDGNVYEVQEGVEAYFFCEHELEEGLQELHVAQDDGGCIVKFYNAKRCRLCGYLTDVVLVGEFKSVLCPH